MASTSAPSCWDGPTPPGITIAARSEASPAAKWALRRPTRSQRRAWRVSPTARSLIGAKATTNLVS